MNMLMREEAVEANPMAALTLPTLSPFTLRELKPEEIDSVAGGALPLAVALALVGIGLTVGFFAYEQFYGEPPPPSPGDVVVIYKGVKVIITCSEGVKEVTAYHSETQRTYRIRCN